MREAYDYVIVGGGSAGCVLASRLSEDPKVQVLMLESGPDDGNPFILMPLGFAKLMGIGESPKTLDPNRPQYLTNYVISPGGNRPQEYWIKGRTIGGSSSINGMVYARGMPADYDGWEASGCPGWGWSDIGRCYREIERHELGAGEWRGANGPLRVSISRPQPLGRDLIAAAVQAGTPEAADINNVEAVSHGGFGPQPCTIYGGQRFSAARAHLKPALGRPNLEVVTGANVTGIEFEGRRACGVRMKTREGARTVRAGRDVILSAGAIHSPKLLQLSGIGPADLLRNLGIDVRVDAPGVGQNLQEHRTIPVKYKLKGGGRARQLQGLGLWISAINYALTRGGALSTCIWEVGGLVKTQPGLDRPDCQIGVTFFSYGANGLEPEPGVTISGYVCRPKSRGSLAITSTDPAAPPQIVANFLADEYDRAHTVSLYRYIRKMAEQPVFARHVIGEVAPGPTAQSDEDLIEASFIAGQCGAHICGTCRMGSDPLAVVDPDLRVRGVGGLRVVDTSIMPNVPSGNTNAPTMALAWRAAERIRAG